ncbi:GATA-type zinc finger protein 1 [Sciurus carolinensis]|uniref:GATA-type zinc finger protein 1 n=1 Tax=Sciurus carolinensis TaxID=30640 RepID=A0AA41SQ82_SCICA|nr:GATA-type zinc finger protein 1 [Sciurus carolinensis]
MRLGELLAPRRLPVDVESESPRPDDRQKPRPRGCSRRSGRNSKNMQTPVSQKCSSMVSPEPPPAPPGRRPRKQLHPCRGTERADPKFQGVTLTFQIKPDSSLQILPTYSSHSQGPSTSSASAPEPNPGGSEALDHDFLGPRWPHLCSRPQEASPVLSMEKLIVFTH